MEYEHEHGVNLIAPATEQITNEQIWRFEVKTALQRMDYAQIQSNIQRMSRLQLLVDVMGRFHRALGEKGHILHKGLFGEYVKSDSLHYCYRIHRSEVDGRLQQIGFDLRIMIGRFAETCKTHPAYGYLVPVFNEQYRGNEEQVDLRGPAQMSRATFQSPTTRYRLLSIWSDSVTALSWKN